VGLRKARANLTEEQTTLHTLERRAKCRRLLQKKKEGIVKRKNGSRGRRSTVFSSVFRQPDTPLEPSTVSRQLFQKGKTWGAFHKRWVPGKRKDQKQLRHSAQARSPSEDGDTVHVKNWGKTRLARRKQGGNKSRKKRGTRQLGPYNETFQTKNVRGKSEV